MRTGPTNDSTRMLIAELNKQSAPIWHRLAYELSKATRNRVVVNVSRLQRFASDGETILVTGKLLSAGELNKKLNVAAWNFSKNAAEKVTKAGGKVMTISELVEKNPKGEKVRILG
ncbi:MAG: 50S ribosomal protein L18e [DPANN group archaeon]|nr:50S ribosomal protein L18e [DPANN group archaeon]